MIINTENDRSNGFVNPLNFRSEIELAPIKGKNMNPGSGDWLETVIPHELVHAVHFNSFTPSLTNIAGLFSPDIRRSVHSAAPFGILEGIAVQYESHNPVEGAGRGNYPFFTNQYYPLIGTENEWSMGQLVHVSDFTFPFDRHYNGGYHFVHWMLENKGDNVMEEAIKFHYKWPFLGFGYALKKKTGSGPSALYEEYSDSIRKQEETRRKGIINSDNPESELIPALSDGMRARRPLWLDNNNLLFHSRFYNSPTGFYRYNNQNGTYTLLKEVAAIEDFKYSLNGNKTELYYSRYKTDPFLDNTFRSNIYKFDLEAGKNDHLSSRKERVFSPELNGDLIFALQTDAFENRPVIMNRFNGEILQRIDLPDGYTLQEIAIHPKDRNLVAVLAKKAGKQAIWISPMHSFETFYENEPNIIFENGSAFDPSWHPVKPSLLFTSDYTGVMNVYLYDLDNQTVSQVTRSIFNSMEASFSPDGNHIAFIRITGEQMIPSILHKNSFLEKKIEAPVWSQTPKKRNLMNRPLMNRTQLPDSSEWELNKYNTGIDWIKPRLWTPVIRNTGDVREIGLRFYSTDDLARQTYSLELTHARNRIWYDLNYKFSGFFPGIGLRAKSEPLFPSLRVENESGQAGLFSFMLQNRELGFNIPFRLFLERNTRFSSLTIRPQYEISQLKFFELNSSNSSLTGFNNIHSFGLTVTFNYRLRQFIRDVQPNSGWVFYTQSEIDLNEADFHFNFNDIEFGGLFSKRQGLRGGVFKYLNLIPGTNQSLRLGAEFLTQTELPQYDNQDLVSDLFSGTVFRAANNMSFLSTRYTIPLTYPDEGGFLLPLYLSNLYIVLFSQTVSDLNSESVVNIANNSRTIFGTGLRSRFRVSNLSIDIGISFGFEPSKNDFTFLFGTF